MACSLLISSFFDKSIVRTSRAGAMGSQSQSGDLAGYVLRDESGVVGFAVSIGDFFKKKSQVLVRIKPACLCGFDQTVKRCGGIGSVRAACEQPVLPTHHEGSDSILRGIIIRRDMPVFQIT